MLKLKSSWVKDSTVVDLLQIKLQEGVVGIMRSQNTLTVPYLTLSSLPTAVRAIVSFKQLGAAAVECGTAVLHGDHGAVFIGDCATHEIQSHSDL
jgi:hypothetical protein